MRTFPIKINRNDWNNIYFISDAHLNHDRPWIVAERGFTTIQDHDKWIIDQLYALEKDDLLINLGDFILKSSKEFAQEVLTNIKCRHLYAANGNHESYVSRIYYDALHDFWTKNGVSEASPILIKHNEMFSLYPFSVNPESLQGEMITDFGNKKTDMKGYDLTFLGESSVFNISNTFLYCRHMAPLIFDKMKHENYICVCGHSHGNCEKLNVEYDSFNKILDIGVDNAQEYNGTAFFSYEDIIKIMANKAINIIDHHS